MMTAKLAFNVTHNLKISPSSYSDIGVAELLNLIIKPSQGYFS